MIIDRSAQEPDRFAIRLRPRNFATMLFIANQLLQIRYNENYFVNVFQRKQRIFMGNNNEFALVPFHDSRFSAMF